MKTIGLTLLIATVFALPLSAQLNTKHNRIRSGDVIVKQQVEFKNPGEAGANRIWDFKDIKTIKDEYRLAYNIPFLLEDSVFFMGSLHLEKEQAGIDPVLAIEHHTLYYYVLRNDSLLLLGHENPSVQMIHHKPVLIMKYPLNYGQVQESEYNSIGRSPGTPDIRVKGTIKVEADAYGKLILPTGDTLNPVLRVKATQTMKDVQDQIITQEPDRLIETYRWYIKGYRYPIFETIQNMNLENQSNVYKTAFYYPPQKHLYLETDPDNLALLDELWSVEGKVLKAKEDKKEETTIESEDKLYKIYPNPVKSTLTIEYTVDKNTPVTIQLYSIDGKLIKTINKEEQKEGTHKDKIDCSHLPQGTYLLKIATHNNTVNYTIIKL